MNYKAVAGSILLFILLCAFKCNKNSDYIGDKIYTATLKSTSSCARYYACVITDGFIDPELVDNNWQLNGVTYQKAFVVKNNCSFPSDITEGTTFRFRIVKSPANNNCMICNIAIMGGPSKSLNIKVIK